MRNEIPNTEVAKLWSILNAEEQGNLTKAEATDLGFTYLIENGFKPNDNSSLPQIYFHMVSENMDNLQWARLTKENLAVEVAKAVGCETIDLSEVDEGGLCSDYAFCSGIFEYYGYIDIYFLVPPIESEVLLITGMTVSDE
jgi:hypothetical protein